MILPDFPVFINKGNNMGDNLETRIKEIIKKLPSVYIESFMPFNSKLYLTKDLEIIVEILEPSVEPNILVSLTNNKLKVWVHKNFDKLNDEELYLALLFITSPKIIDLKEEELDNIRIKVLNENLVELRSHLNYLKANISKNLQAVFMSLSLLFLLTTIFCISTNSLTPVWFLLTIAVIGWRTNRFEIEPIKKSIALYERKIIETTK